MAGPRLVTVAAEREFVVVGGGLLGLAAAGSLARRGREVTVLEQASVGHTAGGSHGTCRIFRLGYGDPRYVTLARRAAELWSAAEADAGDRFLHPVPHLTFGAGLAAVHEAMRAAGASSELLTAEAAVSRFPALTVGGPALLEPDSAVIAADRVLRALATAGPEIITATRVSSVSDDGRRVTVRTPGRDYTARVVIIAAGPWTRALLAPAGITVPGQARLEQVAYLKPARPGPLPPVFIQYGWPPPAPSPYGLPVPGTGEYKIGIHQSGPVTDPDHQDRGPDPAAVRQVAGLAAKLLPGLDPEPVRAERCVYDNSPDEDFIVDRIGNVVIGSGTSGHGFKFGPLFGEWLAGLATRSADPAPPAWFALR